MPSMREGFSSRQALHGKARQRSLCIASIQLPRTLNWKQQTEQGKQLWATASSHFLWARSWSWAPCWEGWEERWGNSPLPSPSGQALAAATRSLWRSKCPFPPPTAAFRVSGFSVGSNMGLGPPRPPQGAFGGAAMLGWGPCWSWGYPRLPLLFPAPTTGDTPQQNTSASVPAAAGTWQVGWGGWQAWATLWDKLTHCQVAPEGQADAVTRSEAWRQRSASSPPACLSPA